MEENNNFLYNGYLLVIDVGGWCMDAKCKELNYHEIGYDIQSLKDCFRQFVDEKLEKEMKLLETFNYLGWELDIYEDKGDYVGINTDLHYQDKRILKACLTENFIQFIKDGRVNKMVEPEKVTDKTPKETFTYKGFTVEIKTLGMAPGIGWIYGGQCKDIYLSISGYLKKSDVIDAAINVIDSKLKEKEVKEVSSIDKDKKIEELVKVISGLNKKLEEKDNKIERLKEFEKENIFLKKKLDTIRIEIFKKAE